MTAEERMEAPREEARIAPRALWAGIALLLVAPIACLWGALPNAYHLDDVYRIEQNVEIERVHPIWRHFTDPRTSTSLPTIAQYRPLLPLTLSLSAWVGDRLELERQVAHRAGNLLVHVLTGLVLWALFAELLRRAPPRIFARRFELAFLAALLFAVHPVAAVPVQYLCARDLGIANLFFALALLAYARMRRSPLGDTPGGWVVTLGLLTVSLLAKTNAAVFFGVVFAFEITLAGGRLLDWRVWARTAAAGVVTVAFFLWTMWLSFSDAKQLIVDEHSWLVYGFTELKVHLFYYLRNAAWPNAMRALPRIEPSGLADLRAWAGAVLVIASLVFAWRARGTRPVLAFCVFTYWVLFALTSSAIPLRSFAADYRQVPSLGFLALFLLAGPLALLPRRATTAAVALAALLLGWATHGTNAIWRTEKSLWTHAVERGTTGRGHQNYARAIQNEDPVEAEEHYQLALLMDPADAYTRINLGLLRIDRGRIADGMAEIELAARNNPTWGVCQHWLAYAHRITGAPQRAARASVRAAELDPRNAEYLYLAAVDLQTTGAHADALAWLERLRTSVGGEYKDSLFRTGWAHHETGRPDKAIPLYEAWLEDNPDSFFAWNNLGLARKTRGDFAGAISSFERALEVSPTAAECHFHLADCYRRTGQPERAVEHEAAYEAALLERRH